MVENDTLTYQVRRTSHYQAKTVDQSLITPERTQKLDLLMHLLANLTQSLIVCGPDGIGKSTLLKVLQERKVNSWLYCPVQGNTELSFEKILQQVAKVMSQDKPKSDLSLSTAFGQYESQNKKIILMIDDAGALVPGLITTLIQYAAANPVLRVIFVLTHDDLYLKSTTDRAIEDCHLVEIPPLSEKQCGAFLQHLAAQPSAQIAFNSISDSLIENIYRETHGIPGKIIAELPDPAKSRHGQNSTRTLVLAVAGLVVIALAIQWFSASNNSAVEKPVAAKADQKAAAIEPAISQPKLSQALKSEPLLLSEQFAQENNVQIMSEPQLVNQSTLERNAVSDVIKSPVAAEMVSAAKNKLGETENVVNTEEAPENKQQLNALKESLSPNPMPTDTSAPSQLEAVQPQLKQAENEVASEAAGIQEATGADDGTSWIMAHPPASFTLQLMVLTKEQAIKDVIKKHPALGDKLTYIKTVSPNGREKFLLLYGSYASAESANKARQALPPEFRQAYARKFSAIKN